MAPGKLFSYLISSLGHKHNTADDALEKKIMYSVIIHIYNIFITKEINEKLKFYDTLFIVLSEAGCKYKYLPLF